MFECCVTLRRVDWYIVTDASRDHSSSFFRVKHRLLFMLNRHCLTAVTPYLLSAVCVVTVWSEVVFGTRSYGF